MNNSLQVLTIVGSSKGYSRVIITKDCFDKVKGSKPVMAFNEEGYSEGNKVRSFDFDGVKLYSLYNRAEGTKFVVTDKDAEASKIATQNANLPFVISEVLVPAAK